MIFLMDVPWYWITNVNYIGNDDNIEIYIVTHENGFLSCWLINNMLIQNSFFDSFQLEEHVKKPLILIFVMIF
jgi:hypothetical protein